MVLMDMPVIDPLLRTGERLLAPDGRFVFAVQHPAFNSNAVRLCAETETRGDGLEVTRHAVKMSDYLVVPAGKGTGMPGEAGPIGTFTAPCTSSSAPSSGRIRPRWTGGAGARDAEPESTRTSWSNLPGIPPILARFVPRPLRLKRSDFGAGTARNVFLREQLSAPRTRLSHRDDSRYSSGGQGSIISGSGQRSRPCRTRPTTSRCSWITSVTVSPSRIPGAACLRERRGRAGARVCQCSRAPGRTGD